MRIKTKITASHTLNEKRNKQTKRKKTTTTTLTTRTTWKYGNWLKSFWEQFVLIFFMHFICIAFMHFTHAFFQSLPIHAQLCISKNRSFFLVFSRSLAHGEKKSYIVLSFDLNPQDNLEQTVTTPSTQLEKAQRMTNRQREKRRGKRKTRPKVKPSQKSKTE